MHLIRSHRLFYVQVPQVVMISYRGRDFVSLVSLLQSIIWGGMTREVVSEDCSEDYVSKPPDWSKQADITQHTKVKCSLVAWVNITSLYDFQIKYLDTVNDSFLGLTQTNVQEFVRTTSLEVTV